MSPLRNPTRRAALVAATGFGLSLDFVSRQAFAASEGAAAHKKLVVVICRGGLDGLSLAPPVGDLDYVALRRGLAVGDKALKLDGTFGLHPSLVAVQGLLQAGQGRLAPAVATPDRARSHFEAQDVLESGASVVYGTSSGWLNRAVTSLSAQRKVEALSVGPTAPLIVRGPAPVSSWSPGRDVDTSARLPTLLQDLYRDDPVLGPALARGLATETMAQASMSSLGGDSMLGTAGMPPAANTQALFKQGAEAARKLGVAVAGFMRAPTGPQIAVVSLDGFDTHANQATQLSPRLAYLDAVLGGLNTGLAGEWRNSVVLVVTEFGRTARINGAGGTDHGTASAALLLGGAVKSGGILGDWPGLRSPALFENRDLAPTLDMRSLFKGVLADHMGVDRRALDTTVFPDSAEAKPLAGLV